MTGPLSFYAETLSCSCSIFFLLPILIADNTKMYTVSKELIGIYLTSQVTLFIQGFLKIVSPKIPSLHSGEACCLIFKLCSFYRVWVDFYNLNLHSNVVTLELSFFFFFFLLFILYWSNASWQQCDSFRWTKRDSAIHIHACFLPQSPAHPGCHMTLNRVPCAVQYVLVGYPVK